jgi:hypothetical protein
MNKVNLESEVREAGYQLALREMRGDIGFTYYKLQKHHNYLLTKLNRINKVA